MPTQQEKKIIKDIAKELNDRDKVSLYLSFTERYPLENLEDFLMEA